MINYLAENAIVIWMCGAVLVTMCGIVYYQTKAGTALLAMLVAVLTTASLLVAERLDRNAARSGRSYAARTRRHDRSQRPSRRAHVHSRRTRRTVRSDAETLMPLVKVNKANIIGTPEITLDLAAQPPTATVRCQGFVDVTLKKNGMKGGYLDRVTIEFVLDGDRWLIEDYTLDRNWRRDAAGGQNWYAVARRLAAPCSVDRSGIDSRSGRPPLVVASVASGLAADRRFGGRRLSLGQWSSRCRRRSSCRRHSNCHRSSRDRSSRRPNLGCPSLDRRLHSSRCSNRRRPSRRSNHCSRGRPTDRPLVRRCRSCR